MMRKYAVMPEEDYVNLCNDIRDTLAEHNITAGQIKSGDLVSKHRDVKDAVYDAGCVQGYNKCTEDMQDELSAKYDEGYAQCKLDMKDDFSNGIRAGRELAINDFTPIILQSESKTDFFITDEGTKLFKPEVYQAELSIEGNIQACSLSDFIERSEYGTSSEFEAELWNNTLFYVKVYVWLNWLDEGDPTHYDGGNLYVELIIPPESFDYVYATSLDQSSAYEESWRLTILGVRFMLNDDD